MFGCTQLYQRQNDQFVVGCTNYKFVRETILLRRPKDDFVVRHVDPDVQKTFRAIVASKGKLRGDLVLR